MASISVRKWSALGPKNGQIELISVAFELREGALPALTLSGDGWYEIATEVFHFFSGVRGPKWERLSEIGYKDPQEVGDLITAIEQVVAGRVKHLGLRIYASGK